MHTTPHLSNLLEEAGKSEAGIILYESDNLEPKHLSYHDLREKALLKAECLRSQDGFIPGGIVLIHFHNHHDNILWFWASILAECVPAMSTPFINTRDGRISHLAHLHRLLLDPIVITSRKLLSNDFNDNTLLRCVAVEDLDISESKERPALDLPPTESERARNTGDYVVRSSSHVDVLPHKETKSSLMPDTERAVSTNSQPVGYNIQETVERDVTCESDVDSDSSSDEGTSSVQDDDHDLSASSSSSVQEQTVSKEHASSNDNAIDMLKRTLDTSTSLKGVAALMLTSGSTGAAKAVCLRHEQILTACRGKLSHMPLPAGATVLNWIGLDHVGSLTELHLTAMVAGCNQVHVPTAEIVANPLNFLRLLSKHGVARTFAPNFMMAKLLQLLDTMSEAEVHGIELRNLLYLISGGEPNSVQVCVRLSAHLEKLGAPTRYTIRPGFGMTETCAGSIYSKRCPEIDLQTVTEFTALGTCVPGIDMRIEDDELQVSGPMVFQRYFNNPEASRAAFTDDGWFRTGDTATIDAFGILRLVGRSKDIVIINGVKYLSHELETAIDQARIPGVTLSHVVCFAYRPAHANTEQIQVVYQREYKADDVQGRMHALRAIIQTILFFAGSRPRVLPLAPGRLERSTLGKLSRRKVMEALLKGDYEDEFELDAHYMHAFEQEYNGDIGDATDQKLMGVFRDCQLGAPGMGIDTPILDTGVTSVDLIRFKRAAERAFDVVEIPMITIMTNTTIRTLATAIKQIQGPPEKTSYNPIITLQPNGDKTPLFLVHPGIGEMLVFLGLVQYFPDRPIYAMRARGLNEGETPFTTQEEIITTYHRALKEKQPHGPYAIAGYSYGSMLAFEISKLLEADGERVKFLGSFNLPPHIKTRMRRLDWTAGMVHIAHFCSIITEERSEELVHELRQLPHDEQVARLLSESDQQRCADLALTHASLLKWVDVSWSLQKIGWEYEPSGNVSHMDIFYCEPLKDVASNRVEYRKNHLNHWVDFIRSDLRFHEVEGQHYTMIDQDHCPKFQQILKKALATRGL